LNNPGTFYQRYLRDVKIPEASVHSYQVLRLEVFPICLNSAREALAEVFLTKQPISTIKSSSGTNVAECIAVDFVHQNYFFLPVFLGILDYAQ
jgi:hypothetical protein